MIKINITQIKYFITVAKCLNISKAADQLYISQPALSRQISSIEQELNCQLFVRGKRSLQLTLPGQIIFEEWIRLYESYNISINKALNSRKTVSGILKIGILDGVVIGDLMDKTIHYFDQFYPQVDVSLYNYDYQRIIEKLYTGDLDLAYTLRFEIENHKNLMFRVVDKTHDYVVVHRNHRLANAKSCKLTDFLDDTFLMAEPENSEQSYKLVLASCNEEGFMPKIRFAPSRLTQMLWVQSNRGVCIFDNRCQLFTDPNIRFLDVNPLSDPSLCMVWHKDNYNFAREIFENTFFASNLLGAE